MICWPPAIMTDFSLADLMQWLIWKLILCGKLVLRCQNQGFQLRLQLMLAAVCKIICSGT